MNRLVIPCTLGQRGCDLDAPLSAEQAVALRAVGLDFVIRYLSLGAPGPGDLSAGETATVLAAGLGLMAVQHVRLSGWTPSRALGVQDGEAAARHALVCGLPKSTILWGDIEGVSPAATADSVGAYVSGRHAALLDAGYDDGGYIGAGLPRNLDATALWHLAIARYWRSQSEVPEVDYRGYQMIQLYPSCPVRDFAPSAPASIAGLLVDFDVTQTDRRGSAPTMLVAR